MNNWSIWFIVSLLLSLLVVSIDTNNYCIVVGNCYMNYFATRLAETRKVTRDSNKFISVGKETKSSMDTKTYTERIANLIGNPNLNTNPRDAIFYAVVQAYNSRLIEDREFNESWWNGQMIARAELYCKRFSDHFLIGVNHFEEQYETCEIKLAEKAETWSKFRGEVWTIAYENANDAEHFLIENCVGAKIEIGSKWIGQLPYVYNECLFAALKQIDVLADFDRYRVNNRKTPSTIPIGPIKRMLLDVQESIDAIKENLQVLEDQSKQNDNKRYLKKVLADFKATLASSPYDQLYGTNVLDEANKSWMEIKRTIRHFRNYKYLEYRKDMDKLVLEHLEPHVEDKWSDLIQVWENYLKIKPVPKDAPMKSILDNGWEYDLSNPIHRLRVGWDFLDGFSEKLKCELKKTYWFHLRNETLRRTQTNLDAAKLFSFVSRTLYQTCRITDTDAIGRCNPENHEICRPMVHSDRQETNIRLTKDFSIYRPKWIYRMEGKTTDGEEAGCKGQRTWIIPINICRCGFITDCGNDLSLNITCVLHENDSFRKQCKGNVGYPCKTLPLARGKHDESCVFGYCDKIMNSCQEERVVYSAA